MLYMLLFAFGVIGITHIIVDGGVLRGFRNFVDKYCPSWFGRLLACYQCSGFWVGVFIGAPLFHSMVKYAVKDGPWYCSWILAAFLCGGAGSFLATLGAAVLNYLEAKAVIELPDVDEDEH